MQTRLPIRTAAAVGAFVTGAAFSAEPGHYDARYYGGRAPARHYDARYYGGSARGHEAPSRHLRARLYPTRRDGCYPRYVGGRRHAGRRFGGCCTASSFHGPGSSFVFPAGRGFVVLPGAPAPFVQAQPLPGHAPAAGFHHKGFVGYRNVRDFYSTDRGPRDYARFYRAGGALKARATQDTPVRTKKHPMRSRHGR